MRGVKTQLVRERDGTGNPGNAEREAEGAVEALHRFSRRFFFFFFGIFDSISRAKSFSFPFDKEEETVVIIKCLGFGSRTSGRDGDFITKSRFYLLSGSDNTYA